MNNLPAPQRKNSKNSITRFDGELRKLKSNGLYHQYEDAVLRVVQAYSMDLGTKQVASVMGSLAITNLTPAQVERAADVLITDPEFRETVRYGGKLCAQDFINALMRLPDKDEYYTLREAKEYCLRFGYDLEEDFRHVRNGKGGQKLFKFYGQT